MQSYSSNSELNNTPVTVYGYPCESNYGFNGEGIYQYKTGVRITQNMINIVNNINSQ